MSARIKVRGQKALIANLRAKTEEARERFRVTTRKKAQEVRDRAVQLAPKDTGYMARNIRKSLSNDELTFEVFCDPDDYLPNGLPFYPLYVHEGTSLQRAQPFLRDAYEQIAPDYAAAIRDDIRKAMR